MQPNAWVDLLCSSRGPGTSVPCAGQLFGLADMLLRAIAIARLEQIHAAASASWKEREREREREREMQRKMQRLSSMGVRGLRHEEGTQPV